MECINCSHTMICVLDGGPSHCPRCGTLFISWLHERDQWVTPKLVARCREFALALRFDAPDMPQPQLWHTLGIAESINPPEARLQ